jgi:hypothetical protein
MHGKANGKVVPVLKNHAKKKYGSVQVALQILNLGTRLR